MNGYIVLINIVMLAVLSFFIGYPIHIAIRNKRQKKEQEKQIEKQKREAEKAKKQKEREEKELRTYLDVYSFSSNTLSLFIKSKEEVKWIVGNRIDPILSDMPPKRLEAVKQSFIENGRITNIGPYNLDKEQLYAWHKDYLNAKARKKYEEEQASIAADEKIKAKRRIEAEKERIANREKAEKDKKWTEYVEKFRKYNNAQQKSEFEWFKKKLINIFTDNQEEKDLLIHELEMIMLEDKK